MEPETKTCTQICTKTCTKCGVVKPKTLAFFYKSVCTKDKLYPHCKVCHKAISKKRQERQGKVSKTTRVPFNFTTHPPLSEKQKIEFKNTNTYPVWTFPCRRCGRLKINTKACFPYQPRAYRDKDGNRLFSTVCRSCQREARKHKSVKVYNTGGTYNGGTPDADWQDPFYNQSLQHQLYTPLYVDPDGGPIY